ncbi:MAG: LptF/LptG family permease [Candidatus Sumerlaeaceae bacterium]|nr:LptF/LptG family permease [Candidatus Sumerlaeaceae bacterium]
MFGIKILDRYLFREFALSIFAVMSFCALLILVAMIFESFQDIIENNTPLGKAVEFFLCSLPTRLLLIIPLASMLAVLFSVGSLARTNEILAFMTNGVSSLRLAAPILFGGFLVFACSMFVSEYVAPPLQQRATYINLRYIQGKAESKITTEKNVFVRGDGNRIYILRAYSVVENRMVEPQIYDMDDNFSIVLSRIEAQSATFLRNDPEGKKSDWLFKNANIWKFDTEGNLQSFKSYPGEVTVYLEENLPDILSQRKTPEEMNFAELSRHVAILAARKQPVYEFMTDLILKVTFPLGVLIVMIIGFSYAVRTRAGTVMSAFGRGVVWAFGYYIVSAVFQAFGHSGAVSPYVAGTLPSIAFALAAAYYFRQSYRWYA